MGDIDPPPANRFYNPENPLESDDEFDDDPLAVLASHTRDRFSENDYIPDDAESNYDDEKQSPPRPNPEPKMYTDLFCVRTYTKEDLYPTELDPNCYPAWTLSPYWPVYVSNFRLNSLDETERNTQISTYFASKGLLSRMIFIRENDDPYYRFQQRKTLLVDMLVYFTCKEDADRAIRCCDKTTYYGHKLNAQSGRVPVFFDPERTVCFQLAKRSFQLTESIMEGKLQRMGCENVSTMLKLSESEMIVEFNDQHSMLKAVLGVTLWIPSRLAAPVRKQRFLEVDCKYEMMFIIAENPSFLDMLPPEDALNDLMNGKLPPVVRDWENWTHPKPLPEGVRESVIRKAQKRKHCLFTSYWARQEAKKNGLPVAPRGPNGAKLRKTEVRNQKAAFFGVRYNVKPQWTRAACVEWTKRKFEKMKEALVSTRSQLLANATEVYEEIGLVTRNKLFYDLLQLERKVGKLIDQNEEMGLECDLLENGLNVAICVAGEVSFFPDYPSDMALSDKQEPLDELWPVFLSNFPVSNLEPKLRNQEVYDFFAAKSYTVRMVYLNESDNFYNNYLKVVKLLDMLVYFDSKAVADEVCATYRKTMYRGSRLSVYRGRLTTYYHPFRTMYLKLDKDPVVAEQTLERVLISIAPDWIHTVTRFPRRAYIAFERKRHKKQAFFKGLSLQRTTKLTPKQRYVEQDVKQHLLQRILYDANFLNDQPNADFLRKLFIADSAPPEGEGGEIVWADHYRNRKLMNARIGAVIAEWQKLQ